MARLDRYQKNRKHWQAFLESTSLSPKIASQLLSKLPNNQTPLTKFWCKLTVEWMAANRHRYLMKAGMNGRHCTHYFRKFDRCHIARQWPADIEIRKIMEEYQRRGIAVGDAGDEQNYGRLPDGKRAEQNMNVIAK